MHSSIYYVFLVLLCCCMFRPICYSQADIICQSIHDARDEQMKTTYYRIPPATRHILTLTFSSLWTSRQQRSADFITPHLPLSKLIVQKECDDPVWGCCLPEVVVTCSASYLSLYLHACPCSPVSWGLTNSTAYSLYTLPYPIQALL